MQSQERDPPLAPQGRNLNSLAFQRQVDGPASIETPQGWPVLWRFDLALKRRAVSNVTPAGFGFWWPPNLALKRQAIQIPPLRGEDKARLG